MAILDKIRKAQEKLERKTYEKKAQSRAKERRIDMGEPEGLFESGIVGAKETKRLGKQASELASESIPGGGAGTEMGKGILSGIGEGGESVIDDVESGNLGPFENDDDSQSMDMDFDDDLDMDLDGF